MRFSKDWKDYELLDCSGGERLERWGDYVLIRPDPQVIWNTPKTNSLWERADARYLRSSEGGGHWDFRRKLPEEWEIGYKDLRFRISPTGFKHTGLFPEQAVNWDYAQQMIKGAGRNIRVLNLFAYTGAATLAAAEAGASVCHVDAAKGMVRWARENAALSKLEGKPVRWIVDDCAKFVEREIRRGSFYDAVILDPPSYGRGPAGEVWKLEDQIYDLIALCKGVLTEKPLFVMLNSYTTGLSASAMEYVLGANLRTFGGSLESGEIGLPVKETGMVLPCGSAAIWKTER
ncbi:MAG TPA: class I SAM-dependent methyltransferase [Oscillospiraceae bacterium]|nr:class I SAM-dependent methyltransferase [Oscillospiraceae bacterium]